MRPKNCREDGQEQHESERFNMRHDRAPTPLTYLTANQKLERSVTSASKMAASSRSVSSRLGQCEVCSQAAARYRCPRCALCSCSLPCVKRHKSAYDCNGLRDKAAYVSLKQFTDLNLLSDYRFLEELGRSVDNASRESFKHHRNRFRGELPYWLHRLVVECHRRDINLLIMPQNFSRRKQNTTVFAGGKRKIFWHIEWHFPQADVVYTDKRVPEDLSLSEALEKYLNPKLANEDVRQRLAFYQSAGYNNVIALMKREFKQKKAPELYSYLELNISKSIMWNLYKKTVVEFPTVIVTLKDHAHMYTLSMSDAEDDSDDTDEEEAVVPVKPTSVVRTQNIALKDIIEDNEKCDSMPECPISDLSDDDYLPSKSLQTVTVTGNVCAPNETGEQVTQEAITCKALPEEMNGRCENSELQIQH